MAVTLMSGKELEERRNEKKKTEEEKHTKIGEELKQYTVQSLLKKREQQKCSKSSKLKREI